MGGEAKKSLNLERECDQNLISVSEPKYGLKPGAGHVPVATSAEMKLPDLVLV